MILCFLVSGCTGSFNLTRKVYNMHRSQSDKWADELTFLVVVLIPVYSFATFVDAIVFNSIEFWTGENPVVYAPTDKAKTVKRDGVEATISKISENEIKIESKVSDRMNEPIILERTDSGVIAKDMNGGVIFTSVKNDSGEVAVYDANNQLVKKSVSGSLTSN